MLYIFISRIINFKLINSSNHLYMADGGVLLQYTYYFVFSTIGDCNLQNPTNSRRCVVLFCRSSAGTHTHTLFASCVCLFFQYGPTLTQFGTARHTHTAHMMKRILCACAWLRSASQPWNCRYVLHVLFVSRWWRYCCMCVLLFCAFTTICVVCL